MIWYPAWSIFVIFLQFHLLDPNLRRPEHHRNIMRHTNAKLEGNTTMYFLVNPAVPSWLIFNLAQSHLQTGSFHMFFLWADCHLFQSAAGPTSMITTNLLSCSAFCFLPFAKLYLRKASCSETGSRIMWLTLPLRGPCASGSGGMGSRCWRRHQVVTTWGWRRRGLSPHSSQTDNTSCLLCSAVH